MCRVCCCGCWFDRSDFVSEFLSYEFEGVDVDEDGEEKNKIKMC